MKLIEEIEPSYRILKDGSKRKDRMGKFECPYCLELVERKFQNGKKNDSCGSKECTPNRGVRHGRAHTSPYNSWAAMKQRCDNPKLVLYKYYGGKGITYPEEWSKFKGFWEQMGNSYKEGLTLDRVDKDKNYSKENCQWITLSENAGKDKEREIIQVDEEGNEIARYPSAKKAAEATGLHYQSLARVARGERKHTQNTYWKYTNA